MRNKYHLHVCRLSITFIYVCVWNKYYLQYMCGISITYIYVSLLFIVSVGGTREIRNLVGQPATVTVENQTKRKSQRKNTQYARSAALRTPAEDQRAQT